MSRVKMTWMCKKMHQTSFQTLRLNGVFHGDSHMVKRKEPPSTLTKCKYYTIHTLVFQIPCE